MYIHDVRVWSDKWSIQNIYVAFGVGVVCGLFTIATLLYTWLLARDFVYGGEILHQEVIKHNVELAKFRPLQYGLFTYPTWFGDVL